MTNELIQQLTDIQSAVRRSFFWSLAWFALAIAGGLTWRLSSYPIVRSIGLLVLTVAVIRTIFSTLKDWKRLAQMRELKTKLGDLKTITPAE
jgi:cytochrome b561